MDTYDPKPPKPLAGAFNNVQDITPYPASHRCCPTCNQPLPPTHRLASRTRGEREWMQMAEFCLTQAAEAAIRYCDPGTYDPRGATTSYPHAYGYDRNPPTKPTYDYPTYPHAMTYDTGATINPTRIAHGHITTLPYATSPQPPDR